MKDCRERAGRALAPIEESVTWAQCPAETMPSITSSNGLQTLTSILYSKSSDTNHFDSSYMFTVRIAEINFFKVNFIFFPAPYTVCQMF